MEAIYQAAMEALRAGEAICVATIVAVKGSTPRGVGTKMLIRADGSSLGTVGGGAMEQRVIEDALQALVQGASILVHYSLRGESEQDLAICGGEMQVFLEVLAPERELLIIGGGHVGLCLAQLAAILGFRIVVVDDREEFANRERFPMADRTLAIPIEALREAVSISARTHVVIVTRDHVHDEEALEAVLGSPAKYIGLVGSRRKVASVFEHLLAKGFTAEGLARVYSPIGLDIGSETPAEIALSILAEIILVERGGSGRPLCESGNPLRQRDANG